MGLNEIETEKVQTSHEGAEGNAASQEHAESEVSLWKRLLDAAKTYFPATTQLTTLESVSTANSQGAQEPCVMHDRLSKHRKPMHKEAIGVLGSRDLAELTSLPKYRDFVASIAADKENTQVLINNTPERAALTVERLLLAAKKFVYIVSEDLDVRVFGDPVVVSAAYALLGKTNEPQIRIVTNSKIDPAHPLIAMIYRKFPGSKERGPRFSESSLERRLETSFVLADWKHYRYQPDPLMLDGIVRFHDPVFGRTIRASFEKLRAELVKAWEEKKRAAA